MSIIIQILIGVLIIIALPLIVYFFSKCQMLGWLHGLSIYTKNLKTKHNEQKKKE